MDCNNLKDHALNIRRNIVQMVYDAQSGHPGGSLGCADILTYLYFVEMDVNKDNVKSANRDRFVLSKGHCSPALYAVLKEAGLLDEDLSSFRQINSKLQGHPNMNYVDGVDMSTGSLGQGVSTAVGMALANKLDENGKRVYALVG
ncbi:MAG: transketolase, partial [Erysipelotrichaceae bacterium]|nr:transketolase [Erysipelotrichaceae bacterium]